MTNPTPTESRVWSLQFRDAEVQQRTITGVAVPYNSPTPIGGAYVEVMSPGCFRKSIQESAKALPLMTFHKHDRLPVGKAVSWEDTQDALIGTWQFADTDDANEMYRMVQDGYISGLSVGFQPIQSDIAWDGDVPIVTRKECRMLETSIVATEAYAGAQITLVRTAGIKRNTPLLDSWRRRFEGMA